MKLGCVPSLLGLLVACHRGPVHKPGEEWLDSIHIEGTKAVSETTLIRGLALHRVEQAEREPDPYLIALDGDRLKGEYMRRGFLDVDVQSRVDRKGDAVELTYTVREGARSTTLLEILNLPPEVTPDAVKRRLDLAEGAPFDYAKLELAKPALLALVQEAGYAHARLDTQVVADRANHHVTVVLDYAPGPRCTFGGIEITGVSSDDLRAAVRARVAFAAGDRYSASALEATRTAIFALQRFSTVRVEPAAGEAAVVPVVISLAEGATHEIKLGGGLGIDPVTFEVRGRVGYEVQGWPFPLDTVTLDFRPAYALLRNGNGYEPRIRAIARLEREDFLFPRVRGTVEAGYDYLQVEAYTSYGPRAALGIVTPLGSDRIQLRTGWAIERVDFRNLNPLVDPDLAHRLGIDHHERIGAFDQTLIVDLRDNPIEPTLGAYGELRIAEGTAYAGGAYTYLEISPELRGYVSIGPVVLAARARVGAIVGDIPATERFFSGGSTSQRGFSERQLSPFVAGDVAGSFRSVPYGGGGLIDTGVEARFPITHLRKMVLGGVVFLDGGDVAETASQLRPTNLNWAAGIGLRLLTIIGPARLDFGYRLDRTGPLDPEPGSSYAVHLSLGEAF